MEDKEGAGVCCDAVLRADAPFEPTPAATASHLDLDPVPASVGLARSFVRRSLGRLGEEGEDSGDTAVLLTSELVTNAILHARTPVQLGVLVDEDQALVCVSDRLGDGSDLTPRSHSQDRPGGRGLALVADLAQTWGITAYTGGKTVWFVLRASRDRPLAAR